MFVGVSKNENEASCNVTLWKICINNMAGILMEYMQRISKEYAKSKIYFSWVVGSLYPLLCLHTLSKKYGLIAIRQIIGFDKLRKRWQRLPNKICFCVIIFGCFFLQSPSSGPTQPVCHLCWVLWQFSRCLLSSISIAFLSTGYPLKISLPNWYNCLWEFPN